MNEGPTQARVLTAEGRGAVAVVSVEGPRALDVVEHGFQPRKAKSLRDTGPDQPRFGRFAGDEVVVIPGPVTTTSVEIHCHGGHAAVSAVLGVLHNLGVDLGSYDANSAFPETSGWASRARERLPDSPTLRVAEILLDQAAGVLDREFQEIQLMAEAQPGAALERIDRLLRNAACGLKMIHGWTVALAGRPNVGKSCLLNRLAGFNRSIVSEVPGTTRDVVSISTAIEGWPIEFVDMAGLRSSADDLESQGIVRAKLKLATADLIVVVLDRSQTLTDDDLQVIKTYPQALRVANKSDLPARWSPADQHALAISAEDGTGMSELCQAVVDRLIPWLPAPAAAVPFENEVVEQLQALRDRCRAAGPNDSAPTNESG